MELLKQYGFLSLVVAVGVMMGMDYLTGLTESAAQRLAQRLAQTISNVQP